MKYFEKLNLLVFGDIRHDPDEIIKVNPRNLSLAAYKKYGYRILSGLMIVLRCTVCIQKL